MSLTKEDGLERIERLSVSRLEAWIEQECVRPETDHRGPAFSEVDLARLHLICTLQDDFDLGEEALPMVLSLIDQLHGVRHALRALADAVDGQPEGVRSEVARVFRERLALP